MAKVKNSKAMQDLHDALEKCKSLAQEAYEIDDSEIGTEVDLYRTIEDAIEVLEEITSL